MSAAKGGSVLQDGLYQVAGFARGLWCRPVRPGAEEEIRILDQVRGENRRLK